MGHIYDPRGIKRILNVKTPYFDKESGAITPFRDKNGWAINADGKEVGLYDCANGCGRGIAIGLIDEFEEAGWRFVWRGDDPAFDAWSDFFEKPLCTQFCPMCVKWIKEAEANAHRPSSKD